MDFSHHRPGKLATGILLTCTRKFEKEVDQLSCLPKEIYNLNLKKLSKKERIKAFRNISFYLKLDGYATYKPGKLIVNIHNYNIYPINNFKIRVNNKDLNGKIIWRRDFKPDDLSKKVLEANSCNIFEVTVNDLLLNYNWTLIKND